MCTKGVKASRVECQWNSSIDTLDQRLDWFLIDIPIDTQWILDQHLINSQSMVGQVSTNSYASIEN